MPVDSEAKKPHVKKQSYEKDDLAAPPLMWIT